MRSVIWVILLFVAAVVAAAALSQNDGLVSIFWAGYRIDTSLNVAVIALVLYWHPRWSPILIALIGAIAFLTHVLYPYAYFDFLALEPAPLALITARNICEVALFATAAIALLVELRVKELANEGRDRLIVDEEGVVPERG